MKKLIWTFAAVAALFSCGPYTGETIDGKGYKLVWSDEFKGSELDRTKWNFDHGNGQVEYGLMDWGNGEQQAYTENNTKIVFEPWSEDQSALAIEVRKEDKDNKSVTSARINTAGKFNITSGRVEARIKVPKGRGLWPAFWLVGEGYPIKNPWPACGEIDILEVKGGIEDNVAHGTFHFGTPGGTDWYFLSQSIQLEHPLYDDYHVYAVEWDEKSIAWFVDGKVYHEQKFSEVEGKIDSKGVKIDSFSPAKFLEPHYIILNVASGGGYVDGKMPRKEELPASMLVDYVRVFKKVGAAN